MAAGPCSPSRASSARPLPSSLACRSAYEQGWCTTDPFGTGANRSAGQEIINPSVFFYNAATEVDLPFNPLGLVAFQFLTMHYVEIRRWRDFEARAHADPTGCEALPGTVSELPLPHRQKPGSVDKDPIFAGNGLPQHEVGYPGGIFDPAGMAKGADLKERKDKELANGRLAMLAFVGFIMAAQVTGKGPLANLVDHVTDPWNTSIMAKSLILPGADRIAPACAIPATATFEGIVIPTPCFLEGLWP